MFWWGRSHKATQPEYNWIPLYASKEFNEEPYKIFSIHFERVEQRKSYSASLLSQLLPLYKCFEDTNNAILLPSPSRMYIHCLIKSYKCPFKTAIVHVRGYISFQFAYIGLTLTWMMRLYKEEPFKARSIQINKSDWRAAREMNECYNHRVVELRTA